MSIEVISNTPPDEKAELVEENKSASVVKADENKEASDASEVADETETDEAEDSASENGGEEGQDEEKKPKKNGFKKRIDKLSRRATEAEERAEYWRQQALKGQSGSQENQQVENKTKTEAQGKPEAKNFETYAEYLDAVTDWKIEQKEKELDAKYQKERAQAEQAQAKTAFETKLETFKKEHSDWDDVMDEVSDIILQPHQHAAIHSSDLAPEVMYEIAQDRELVERLSKMTYADAIKAVGRIEDRIAARSSESKKEIKQTKAPPPVKPIGSSKATAKKSIYDANISQEEYEALRREQRKAKRA